MAKSFKAPLAAWLACAGALLLLALIVFGIDAAQRLDARLLAGIMTPTGEQAGPLVNAVARSADPLFLVLLLALACGIALQRRRPLDAAAAATVVVGANLTSQLLKALLAHPRLQPALLHGEMPPGSFPSGHATAAASIAIAFAFVVPSSWRPAVGALGACFVVAVDVAVLILAWHYPSDVLAGTLVACGWGFGVLAALRYIETPVAGQPVSRPDPPPSPRSSPAPPDWQASRG